MAEVVWRKPDEWCAVKGLRVLDPDGWRMKGAPGWDESISEEEFDERAGMSTVGPTREPCAICGHSRAALWFGLSGGGEHSEDDGSCITCGPELGKPVLPVTAASGADTFGPAGGFRNAGRLSNSANAPASGADQPGLRDQLAEVALRHQRPGIGVCGCGGMRLGESYTEHLADALLPLIEADRERAKAEAAVEGGCAHEWEEGAAFDSAGGVTEFDRCSRCGQT